MAVFLYYLYIKYIQYKPHVVLVPHTHCTRMHIWGMYDYYNKALYQRILYYKLHSSACFHFYSTHDKNYYYFIMASISPCVMLFYRKEMFFSFTNMYVGMYNNMVTIFVNIRNLALSVVGLSYSLRYPISNLWVVGAQMCVCMCRCEVVRLWITTSTTVFFVGCYLLHPFSCYFHKILYIVHKKM